MPRSARVLGFACLLLALSEPVLAECTDVPAPGVYWRRCLQDAQNLRDVDLTGATLRDASFKRSDLTGASLVDADARRAKFVSTILQEVQFDGANLVQADFTNADLTGASLKNADLTRARLFRANFSGADLTGARLDETDLLKAEFGGAEPPGARQIVALDVDLVQTSCGFGVPLFEYGGERASLTRWAKAKGEAGLEAYRREKNARSMDGLPTGFLDEALEPSRADASAS
jgi:uncharacterized protein YjbI with pentapeptide repeats